MLGWARARRPVLLVVEDAHGADGPSLELAGYAARRLAGLRVMMLITRREFRTASIRTAWSMRCVLAGCSPPN